MVRLGLTPSGGPNGPIGRLRDQMQRLFGATIAFTQDGESDGEWHDAGFRVARETHLWWDPHGPEQAATWRSTVTLSQGFFEAITERPVPIDLRALRALRSPLALDLYLWLTYRNSYLRRLTRVPWALLALQLGADYQDQRDFKRKVLRSLSRVLLVYPTARVQQVRGGLQLRPAPCHVKRSPVFGSQGATFPGRAIGPAVGLPSGFHPVGLSSAHQSAQSARVRKSGANRDGTALRRPLIGPRKPSISHRAISQRPLIPPARKSDLLHPRAMPERSTAELRVPSSMPLVPVSVSVVDSNDLSPQTPVAEERTLRLSP